MFGTLQQMVAKATVFTNGPANLSGVVQKCLGNDLESFHTTRCLRRSCYISVTSRAGKL